MSMAPARRRAASSVVEVWLATTPVIKSRAEAKIPVRILMFIRALILQPVRGVKQKAESAADGNPRRETYFTVNVFVPADLSSTNTST